MPRPVYFDQMRDEFSSMDGEAPAEAARKTRKTGREKPDFSVRSIHERDEPIHIG